jgi:hypothetical protein
MTGIPTQSLRPEDFLSPSIEAAPASTLDLAGGVEDSSNPHRDIVSSLRVLPVPFVVARDVIVRRHYTHSFPGGTQLTLGVFRYNSLQGIIVFGVGPQNAFRLVNSAEPRDCLTLTRLWLSEMLPANSESRSLGIVLKSLRRNTDLKFLITYADGAQGHVGTIYQATNWLYTGLSTAMPRYDLGNGIPRHSRSVAQILGSHSIKFLNRESHLVNIIPQSPKHRYLYFLNQAWRTRLNIPVLPYPKFG